MMLDEMRIKMRSRRLGVPKDKLLEVEAMGREDGGEEEVRRSRWEF